MILTDEGFVKVRRHSNGDVYLEFHDTRPMKTSGSGMPARDSVLYEVRLTEGMAYFLSREILDAIGVTDVTAGAVDSATPRE